MKVQESTIKLRKYQKLHETKRKYQKVQDKNIKKKLLEITSEHQKVPYTTRK